MPLPTNGQNFTSRSCYYILPTVASSLYKRPVCRARDAKEVQPYTQEAIFISSFYCTAWPICSDCYNRGIYAKYTADISDDSYLYNIILPTHH